MKIKVKHIILFSILLIILIGSTIYIISGKKKIAKENTNELKSGSTISMMIETKVNSGEYKLYEGTKWHTSGYIYNAELSYCENGSTLSWNEETNSVSLRTRLTDKCYVYFDVEPPDVYVSVSNLPTKLTEAKLGSVNCDGGTSVYNQRYNRIEISQVSNKYNSCTLDYTESADKQNLATYIIDLATNEPEQGTGQVVNENGYRYEGKNPNNYVWFNNEYWRIIGVFDSASHGQSGKNLIKIIRDEVLGALVWDKSNVNNWATSSLISLLNGAYYNADDGTNSGYCYSYSTTLSMGNCDYTTRGIQDKYRGMIQSVTWYLGSSTGGNSTAEGFYSGERGTTVYSGRPTSTTGYIGLMYPSDYGYSVLSSSCVRTTNLGSYGSAACAGNSWLYGKGILWTLMPGISYANYVYYVDRSYLSTGGGSENPGGASIGYGVLPVLYLNSSVYKIAGDGSLENPYLIGM